MTKPAFIPTRTRHLYKRGEVYYVMGWIDGHRRTQSLKLPVDASPRDPGLTPEQREAGRREAYAAAARLVPGTWAQLVEYWRHGGREREQAARPYSTLAEISAAYIATAAGAAHLTPATAKRNAATLDLVAREALGLTADTYDPEKIRADILIPDTFRRFEAARITAARAQATEQKLPKQEAQLHLSRAQNTVKSAAAKLRSLFAGRLLESPAYAKLVLPDLTPLMKLKISGTFRRAPDPMPAATRAALLATLAAGPSNDPAQWWALQLAWECGLRRDSAIHARWSWFEPRADGSVRLTVQVAKRGAYIIHLPADLWAEWQQLKTPNSKPETYVIPGDELARTEAIERAGQHLRTLGITAAKPYHELRKAHAQSFGERYGIAEAGLRLGHKPQGVTAANYLEKTPVSRIVARMA